MISQVGFVELLRAANDRGEQEERQPEHQEHIADRRDVLDDRQRDRDDVRERSEMEQEVGVERRRQDVVEAGRDVGRGQAGGRERRFPDRHVAAVDDDDDRIRQDPDEDEDHARVAAVRPQRHEEEPERPGQEREPQRLDGFDARVEEDVGHDAKQERDRQQLQSPKPDRGQVDDVAAGDQAKDESEDDAADQHGRVPGFTGASCVEQTAPRRVVACPRSTGHVVTRVAFDPGRWSLRGPGRQRPPRAVAGVWGARCREAERPSGRLRPDRPAWRPWRRYVRPSSDRRPAR